MNVLIADSNSTTFTQTLLFFLTERERERAYMNGREGQREKERGNFKILFIYCTNKDHK